MRGLVGATVMCTMMGWFADRSLELAGDVKARVDVMTAAASAREQAAGVEADPIVSSGTARPDWQALLGSDPDLPTGQKQRALWKDQTARLLAGEPVNAADARSVPQRAESWASRHKELAHRAAELRHAELTAQAKAPTKRRQ